MDAADARPPAARTERTAAPTAAGSGPGDSKVWTVSELTKLVKDLLEQTVYPLWIAGEVSNLTIHRSGHVYFTIKDARSQLAAVYFSGAGAARAMNLRDGMEVEAFGKLTVYEPRGNYQLAVRFLRPKGLGSLQMQFELLKQKLLAEGLFESSRKRPIPALPRCVGVVTSPTGAALHDFLTVIRRRYAGMHVRIYPAMVQGARAAAEVAAGVRYFNEQHACDVIVVTRGGGSLEDLWGFNDEALARTIAASAIPVISAVGHEVDFTIADFVADLRAPTPSAAAELVVSRHADIVLQVENLVRRLLNQLRLRLSHLRQRVQYAAGHHVFRQPMTLVRLHQQRVDECSARLHRALGSRVERSRARLDRRETQLRLLNPRAILGRGYAILLGRDGQAVTDPVQVQVGDPLRGIVAHGELPLTRPAPPPAVPPAP